MRWISKLSIIVTSLVFGLSLGLSSTANANSSVENACRSLDRPNIDCVCVSKRVETYQKFSPTPEAKVMIEQNYRRTLGLENDYEASAKAAFGNQDDMQRRLRLEISLEPVGGIPSNITDLEEGCVIKGAAPIKISTPRDVQGGQGFSTNSYIDKCMSSVGGHDGGRRFCQCTAERLTYRLTDHEFEAGHSGFIYEDQPWSTLEEKFQIIANGMGVSRARLDVLRSSITKKTKSFEERDGDYCGARLWADRKVGQTAEERKLAGFEPKVLAMSGQAPDLSALTSGSKRDQAVAILSKDCEGNGNSDAYCACYIRDFQTRVVATSPDDNTTLAFALMNGGGALPTIDYMSALQSVPQSAHEGAAMMSISIYDLGEACTQGEVSEPTPMKGTPAERMTAICVKENDNETMCQCMTGQLESRLSPDDFELIVDIREADAQGAPDPLAKVAGDRGLSKAEAEEAMAMNQSMMGAVMGMDMMACVGGMPSMPGFPNGMPGGMPNIPGMPGQ